MPFMERITVYFENHTKCTNSCMGNVMLKQVVHAIALKCVLQICCHDAGRAMFYLAVGTNAGVEGSTCGSGAAPQSMDTRTELMKFTTHPRMGPEVTGSKPVCDVGSAGVHCSRHLQIESHGRSKVITVLVLW
jgi:hypothetical protein